MKKFINFKIVLIASFLVSILISSIYLNKFENNFFNFKSYKYSSLYQEDTISYYFLLSDKIIEDKNDGKNFFKSGDEYVTSFLYPRIIYFFNNLVNNNKKIFNENENKIYLENHKLLIYSQILLFYFSLIIFYFTISKNYEKKLSKIICVFLFINPIIFQWHLSFLTESIFLSFLILLICFLIRSKSFFHFLLIGIFIGLMYMQRTITIFYPLVILIYIALINEKLSKKIINLFSLTIGMILILVLIGFHNYSRAGIFYFTPTQSKLDLQRYIEADVIKISKKISFEDARKELNNFNLSIINNYNYDISKEPDRIQYFNKIQKKSFQTLLENKIITSKIIIKNYFHTLLLNPVQVYYGSKYQHWTNYKGSPEHKFWLKIRIVITIIFFIISGIGLIFSIKKIDPKLNIFLILSILYFFVTSCWLPNTRYFTPSVLFMSIYFSIFLNEINFNFLKKTKINK